MHCLSCDEGLVALRSPRRFDLGIQSWIVLNGHGHWVDVHHRSSSGIFVLKLNGLVYLLIALLILNSH